MKAVKLIIIACLYILSGCSRDINEPIETPISGYFKIISIESTIELDLNNDRIKSKDLYKEISGLHTCPDNTRISFYDFESIQNYMEVRPLKYHTNKAQLISLNFPYQIILDLEPNKFFLSEYIHSLMNYSYELDSKSNKIELTSNNPDFDENVLIKDFELLPNGSLKLEMTKYFFDFLDLKWIETDIIILYQKVD